MSEKGRGEIISPQTPHHASFRNNGVYVINHMLEGARHYLELKPAGVRSAVQVYKAYAYGLIAQLVFNEEFVTIEQFLSRDSMVRYNGLLLYARARCNDLGYYARRTKPWTSKWFQPRRDEVVVDCGSHVGIFTLVALTKGANVHAFEANPATFLILKKNVELNGFGEVAHLYNMALSDVDGTVTLYAPNVFTGTASLRSDWANGRGNVRQDSVTALQIPAITLDHALEGLKAIDWLLIDVEGVEDALLRGAVNLLNRTRKVIIEICDEKSTSVRDQLLQHGFLESARGTHEDRLQYFLFTRGDPSSDVVDTGPVSNSHASKSQTKGQ